MKTKKVEIHRGRWIRSDWHSKYCDGTCEKSFCRKHRVVFPDCQDIYFDPGNREYTWDRNCVKCKNEFKEIYYRRIYGQ
jgi:hypothetical protein